MTRRETLRGTDGDSSTDPEQPGLVSVTAGVGGVLGYAGALATGANGPLGAGVGAALGAGLGAALSLVSAELLE